MRAAGSTPWTNRDAAPEKDKAEQDARRIEGVTDVHNDLMVQRSG
jgi:hypothetical protein